MPVGFGIGASTDVEVAQIDGLAAGFVFASGVLLGLLLGYAIQRRRVAGEDRSCA